MALEPMNQPTIPSTFGVGIIGLGMIADFHAQAIAHVRGARLVGVASRDAVKAETFAQKYKVEFSTGRMEELLARRDIHLVCVTTSSGAHLEPALAAIRAGKHVVIEKPSETPPSGRMRFCEQPMRPGLGRAHFPRAFR